MMFQWRERVWARLFSLGWVMLFVLAGRDWLQAVGGFHKLIDKFSLQLVVPVVAVLLVGLVVVFVVLLWAWKPQCLTGVVRLLLRLRLRLGWARWAVIVLLPWGLVMMLMYTPLGFKLTGVALRLSLFLMTLALMGYFATWDGERVYRWRPLLGCAVFLGAAIVFGREFVTVTDFPLSLTWSEGNRIWDYSWLYGRRLYDYPLDKHFDAYIDIGRQSLWGLPFLFDGVTIKGIRLWSAFLFTMPYILLGWMVLRPFHRRFKDWFWAGVWIFLFLYQGPIYTPLVLSAILVAGARRKPLWLALPLVYLAGYYAQASRLTWMIAPAVWAALMALLDADTSAGERLPWPSWLRVAALGLAGVGGGVGLRRGWVRIARQLGLGATSRAGALPTPTPIPLPVPVDTADAVETLSQGSNTILTDQPLLWDRLWPNPTNPLGILPELLLAVLPLLVLLGVLLITRRWRLNNWQKLGLAGAALGFLFVGLIVSVKIGGGNNLHNLDMFLITLVFAAAAAWEHGGGELLQGLETASLGMKALILSMIVIPAFMPLVDAAPLELPKPEHVDYSLSLLRAETERVLAEGGEVLFMDQRQLLTFGVIQAPLVPEYEKKLVMDRALAGDREYFADFYRDLANQRFGMIVVDPQRIRYSRDDEAFGAENDAWVKWVTEPLYCFYEDKYSHDETQIYVFVPREEIEDCDFLQP